MARPLLITIPLSHYCERARWALDHAGIDYDEEHQLQPFARRRATRLGASGTLPVLVTRDEILGDSADIVHWASERAEGTLYPKAYRDEIEAFEKHIAGEFGVESRRFVYSWFLPTLGEYMEYNSGAAPISQHFALRLLWRPALGPLRRRFGILEENMEHAMTTVRRGFDLAARQLGDKSFLFGEGFSAADLTFSCMAAPSLLPPGYGVPMPPLEESVKGSKVVRRAQRFLEEMRSHEAGRFALGMFRKRPAVRARFARDLRVKPRDSPKRP